MGGGIGGAGGAAGAGGCVGTGGGAGIFADGSAGLLAGLKTPNTVAAIITTIAKGIANFLFVSSFIILLS